MCLFPSGTPIRCMLDLTLQPCLLDTLSYFSVAFILYSILSNFSRSVFKVDFGIYISFMFLLILIHGDFFLMDLVISL